MNDGEEDRNMVLELVCCIAALVAIIPPSHPVNAMIVSILSSTVFMFLTVWGEYFVVASILLPIVIHVFVERQTRALMAVHRELRPTINALFLLGLALLAFAVTVTGIQIPVHKTVKPRPATFDCIRACIAAFAMARPVSYWQSPERGRPMYLEDFLMYVALSLEMIHALVSCCDNNAKDNRISWLYAMIGALNMAIVLRLCHIVIYRGPLAFRLKLLAFAIFTSQAYFVINTYVPATYGLAPEHARNVLAFVSTANMLYRFVYFLSKLGTPPLPQRQGFPILLQDIDRNLRWVVAPPVNSVVAYRHTRPHDQGQGHEGVCAVFAPQCVVLYYKTPQRSRSRSRSRGRDRVNAAPPRAVQAAGPGVPADRFSYNLLEQCMKGEEGAQHVLEPLTDNVGAILVEKVFSSANRPRIVRLKFRDESQQRIFVKRDKLSRDRFVMKMSEEFNRKWRNVLFIDEPVAIRTYNVTAGEGIGYCDVVERFNAFVNIFDSNWWLMTVMKLRPYDPQLSGIPASKKFFASLAGTVVMWYVLGVGDRHQDNFGIEGESAFVGLDYGTIGHWGPFPDTTDFPLPWVVGRVLNAVNKSRGFLQVCNQCLRQLEAETADVLMSAAANLDDLDAEVVLLYIHDQLEESIDAERVLQASYWIKLPKDGWHLLRRFAEKGSELIAFAVKEWLSVARFLIIGLIIVNAVNLLKTCWRPER